MNDKAACSFWVKVLDRKDQYSDPVLEIDQEQVVCSVWTFDGSYEFDPDFLESFKHSEEIKKLEPDKEYFVFMFGSISGDWSYTLEYGREFDGWIFEPEFISVSKLGEKIS